MEGDEGRPHIHTLYGYYGDDGGGRPTIVFTHHERRERRDDDHYRITHHRVGHSR